MMHFMHVATFAGVAVFATLNARVSGLTCSNWSNDVHGLMHVLQAYAE